MICNHDYKIWQYVVKKGYYPLEPACKSTVDTMPTVYKEVLEPVLV